MNNRPDWSPAWVRNTGDLRLCEKGKMERAPRDTTGSNFIEVHASSAKIVRGVENRRPPTTQQAAI
jgi:hypothetical protein